MMIMKSFDLIGLRLDNRVPLLDVSAIDWPTVTGLIRMEPCPMVTSPNLLTSIQFDLELNLLESTMRTKIMIPRYL